MSRRTILYLVVLVALAGLTAVQRLTRTGPAPIAYQLPAVAEDAATKVVLTDQAGSVVLERGEAGWMLTSPLTWPADKTAVESVVRAFEKPISMDFLVSERTEDQGTYEVTEAQALKVEVFTGGALPEIAFYLGKNGPMGTNFIRPVGSAEIYRAKVGSTNRFKKEAGEWRDKRVLLVEADDITSLKVAPAAGPAVEVVREADGWVSRAPAGLKLDRSVVDAMARAFANLRATDIVEGAAPADALQAPDLTVSATLKDGKTLTLTVGAEKEAGSRWVGRSTDTQAFVVRDTSLTSLRKGPADLRDKALLSFKAEEVTRITATEGAKRVVIEAGDAEGDWRLVEGMPSGADAQALKGILAALGSLRAVDFHEDMSPDVAGLGADAIKVEVGLQGDETVTLSLGKDADAGQIYARVGDGPVVTVRKYVSQNVRKLLPAG